MTGELKKLLESPELIEIGRQAIEDQLIEMRDARWAMIRGNGLVVCEKDGSPSSIIRMGPEGALRVGLQAIIDHVSGRLIIREIDN